MSDQRHLAEYFQVQRQNQEQVVQQDINALPPNEQQNINGQFQGGFFNQAANQENQAQVPAQNPPQ